MVNIRRSIMGFAPYQQAQIIHFENAMRSLAEAGLTVIMNHGKLQVYDNNDLLLAGIQKAGGVVGALDQLGDGYVLKGQGAIQTQEPGP